MFLTFGHLTTVSDWYAEECGAVAVSVTWFAPNFWNVALCLERASEVRPTWVKQNFQLSSSKALKWTPVRSEQRKAGPGVTHARRNRTNLTSTAGQRRESVTQTWSPGRCSDLRLVPVLLICGQERARVHYTAPRGPVIILETSSVDYLQRHHFNNVLMLVIVLLSPPPRGFTRCLSVSFYKNHLNTIVFWDRIQEHNTILYTHLSSDSRI